MFTPWSFSPLVLRPALWLDASDASTLYSGASLTAPNGALSEWRDKSGNARHATQASGISQPLRKLAIIGSRDGVLFDGVNDALYGSLFNMSSMSVFVVFTPYAYSTATHNYARVFSQRGTGDEVTQSGHYIPVIRNATVNGFASWASGSLRSTYTVTPNSPTIVTSLHTGSQISNYKDGTLIGNYAHTLGVNGSVYGVGGSITGTSDGRFNGVVHEIIVIPNTSYRLEIESYLRTKWATP